MNQKRKEENYIIVDVSNTTEPKGFILITLMSIYQIGDFTETLQRFDEIKPPGETTLTLTKIR